MAWMAGRTRFVSESKADIGIDGGHFDFDPKWKLSRICASKIGHCAGLAS